MITNNEIKLGTIMSAVTIPAGGYSEAIFDNQDFVPNGFFSVQSLIEGSGTCKCEVYVSNDRSTFVKLDTALFTGKTAGSYFHSYNLPLCSKFKVRFTETGASQSVVVSATIAIQ